jgi:hypothetical protein
VCLTRPPHSSITLELPPPVVGCAAPEYYALDVRPAGTDALDDWEPALERLLPGPTSNQRSSTAPSVSHQPGAMPAAASAALSSAARGRVVVPCDQHAVVQVRLRAFNGAGNSPPSAPSLPLVCGASQAFFYTPPTVRPLSSASFALSWAADTGNPGAPASSSCVDGVRWDVLYRRTTSNGGPSDAGKSGGEGGGVTREKSDHGAEEGEWHLLAGSRSMHALRVEPFRCNGCTFKVRAHLQHAGDVPPLESTPSHPVSSRRLPRASAGASRFELSVRSGEGWSELRFGAQLAAVMRLFEEQARAPARGSRPRRIYSVYTQTPARV